MDMALSAGPFARRRVSCEHANRFRRDRQMKTLWLVTARAGSKSIPHKNIRPLGGHPLLAWRIAAARSLAGGDPVWLSTDDEEYAALGEQYGAEVPFLRPRELATDAARSIDVALHAMEVAEGRGMSP